MAKSETLPMGILKSDTVRPKWDDEDQTDCTQGAYGEITMYKTARFGWCISTLLISRGKNGQPDRSYGINMQEQGVRIGNGPHVTETMTVYLRRSRVPALKPLIDLYVKGLVQANSSRDRRSSRIMQGQEMRAQGRRSWTWDV